MGNGWMCGQLINANTSTILPLESSGNATRQAFFCEHYHSLEYSRTTTTTTWDLKALFMTKNGACCSKADCVRVSREVDTPWTLAHNGVIFCDIDKKKKQCCRSN